jgi:hypothetical protein
MTFSSSDVSHCHPHDTVCSCPLGQERPHDLLKFKTPLMVAILSKSSVNEFCSWGQFLANGKLIGVVGLFFLVASKNYAG